jgi:hypothetical protein
MRHWKKESDWKKADRMSLLSGLKTYIRKSRQYISG